MLRSTSAAAAAKRVLFSLERRLASLSVVDRSFSSSEAAAVDIKPFPCNLYIDTRSAFAPKKVYVPKPAVVDEEEEEEKGLVLEDEEEKEDYETDDEEEEERLMFRAPRQKPVIPLPDRLHVPIYNFGSTKKEQAGTIWLNESLFGKDPIRVDFLKRAVDYYRAKKRGMRKAHTKTISELRGSTRKLRPQKGQGMARIGHKKAGHLRGGAKAHGPKKETNYGSIKMNKKVKRQAVQHVLAAKLKQGDLIVVNQFHSLPSHKTKVLSGYLKPFGIAGRGGVSALLLDHYWPSNAADDEDEENAQATGYKGVPVNLGVASGNLKGIKIGNQLRNLNVYDVLKYNKLVLTVDALMAIEARLKED